MCSTSKSNSALMSRERYENLIRDVKKVKDQGKKAPYDYWLTKHYDVLKMQGVDKLIYPLTGDAEDIRFYISVDELFDVLCSIHQSVGHGGREKMMYEINRRYKNVTQNQVTAFIRCCEVCESKKSGAKKGIVVKPMIFKNFNTRSQLDLIDMQSQTDGEYKYIFVYQDHLTKFVTLRPLTSKRANEVAENLLDVFLTFGAPCVLQTDNGREFRNAVIDNLKQLWPELTIVHGKPRHSQSQGSVERANQDIENMLCCWMKDNSTTAWSKGLRFVQFMKNRSLHSGIKRSPYEAMFGVTPKVGLSDAPLPESVLCTLKTEEDLEMALEKVMSEGKENEVPSNINSVDCDSHLQGDDRSADMTCTVCDAPCSGLVCELCRTNITCCEVCEAPCSGLVCELCRKLENTKRKRDECVQSLEKQALKMRKKSDANFPNPDVGDTVRVQVPDVDRGKTDARSILACVIEKTEDGFYRLGTREGIINSLYARSQFALSHEQFVQLDEVPITSATISLRSVASSQATGNGQGFVRCHCMQKCINKRCLCVKNGIKCNSKCHGSNSCCNK
ncbi:hypothetical protein V9T40_006941 [Parthenolecanium corni]